MNGEPGQYSCRELYHASHAVIASNGRERLVRSHGRRVWATLPVEGSERRPPSNNAESLCMLSNSSPRPRPRLPVLTQTFLGAAVTSALVLTSAPAHAGGFEVAGPGARALGRHVLPAFLEDERSLLQMLQSLQSVVSTTRRRCGPLFRFLKTLTGSPAALMWPLQQKTTL